MTENDTTSAGRIYIKYIFQELCEAMGLVKLYERVKDPTLTAAFAGLFPRDNPQNARFAVNFFTMIGLGGLTIDLREWLEKGMKRRKDLAEESSDESSSSSDSSSDSGSDSSSSDDSSSDSDSSDSSDSSSESSDDEKAKKKKKSSEKTSKNLGKDKKKHNEKENRQEYVKEIF